MLSLTTFPQVSVVCSVFLNVLVPCHYVQLSAFIFFLLFFKTKLNILVLEKSFKLVT